MIDPSFIHMATCIGFGAAIVGVPSLGAVFKFKAERDAAEAERVEAFDLLKAARGENGAIMARRDELQSALTRSHRCIGELEADMEKLLGEKRLAETVAANLQDQARRRSNATSKGNVTRAAKRREGIANGTIPAPTRTRKAKIAANANEQKADNDRGLAAA